MKYHFWTGGYASTDEPGLTHCSFDPKKGFELHKMYCGFHNPSYLIRHPTLPVLYSVEENAPDGHVCVWSLRQDGPVKTASVPSEGADPCHLSLSKDLSRLYISNYSSGSLTCYSLDEKGMPTGIFDHRQHTGNGPNSVRQEHAHVHFAMEYSNRVYVCDLGLDTIFSYTVHHDGLKPEMDRFIHLPGGCGPRHLALNPSVGNVMYCVAELANAVFVLRQNPEQKYEMVQVRPTLPDNCFTESTAAAIKITDDGRYLMASNRGHDSIAVCKVRADGLLEAPVVTPCIASPRDFMICGRYVIAGSQTESVIRAYRFDRKTCRLLDTGYHIPVHKPTCFVLFEN